MCALRVPQPVETLPSALLLCAVVLAGGDARPRGPTNLGGHVDKLI